MAGDLSPAPATYPEVVTERAAPPPLFGLAPHGVCPAGRIAAAAVRSYRTISPLPAGSPAGGIVFCGTFRETRFERVPPAVSRHAALWRPDFPLAVAGPHPASDCPSGRPAFIMGGKTRLSNCQAARGAALVPACNTRPSAGSNYICGFNCAAVSGLGLHTVALLATFAAVLST